jgi:hypothetical protein
MLTLLFLVLQNRPWVLGTSRSNVLLRQEILVGPVRNINPPISPSHHTLFLYAPLQLRSQKDCSYVDKTLKGAVAPLVSPAPTYAYC